MGTTYRTGRAQKLSPQSFQILLVLSDSVLDAHAILREIERLTQNSVQLTVSTLYSALARMKDNGLVHEAGERPVPGLGDEGRRHWSITEDGRELLMHEARRLEQVSAMVRRKGLTGFSAHSEQLSSHASR